MSEETRPRRPLTKLQRAVLIGAFVPMVVTGGAGATGTFSNISHAYGRGTALGAVAAGEGVTAVLALVLLGLTMLGQTSHPVIRVGLWVLPASAAAMSAMAAPDTGRAIIYALTPMGMCVAAEGMAFLARRIVVHQDGRDADADRKAAATVQALAYQRALSANHPDKKKRHKAERKSWKLAKKVGVGDTTLAPKLLTVQRERVTDGADTALASMFAVTPPVTPVTPPVTPPVTAVTDAVTPPALPQAPPSAPDSLPAPPQNALPEPEDDKPQASAPDAPAETVIPLPTPRSDTSASDVVTPVTVGVTPVTDPVTDPVTGVTDPVTADEPDTPDDDGESAGVEAVTLEEIAAVAGVLTPVPGEPLTDAQLDVVLRHLRYSDDPPLSYRKAAEAFRAAGFVSGEGRIRKAWGELVSREESNTEQQ